MDFCRNRPEGFASYTILDRTVHLPTTCMIDNFLVPIPTIALVLAIVYAKQLRLFNSSPHRKLCRQVTPVLLDAKQQDEKSHLRAQPKEQPQLLTIVESGAAPQIKNKPRTWTSAFPTLLKYYFYIGVTFLSMKIGLECYQRVQANQGLGQLPLTLAGAILVTLIYYLDDRTKAHTRARLATSCYWITLGLIFALKGLVLWRDRKNGETGPEAYPIGTQLLDCLGMVQATIPMGVWDLNIYQDRTLKEREAQLTERIHLNCIASQQYRRFLVPDQNEIYP